MRSREERRDFTARKEQKRKSYAKALGMQQGTLYEKHVEKFNNSTGYVRDGNLTHYVNKSHRPYPYKREHKSNIDKYVEEI